jgi:hypothetical protein
MKINFKIEIYYVLKVKKIILNIFIIFNQLT